MAERINFEFMHGTFVAEAHVECEVTRWGGRYDGYNMHDFSTPIVDKVWIDENHDVERDSGMLDFVAFDQLAMVEFEKQEIYFRDNIDENIACRA
jgi:hypothetical protein